MRVLSMDDAVLAKRPDLGGPSEQPAHSRIATWLETLIVSGRLAAGDKLPAEVEIAGALGVSRMTLRQALGAIEAKGLIRRSRGRFGGNFVETPRLEFDHTGLPGFTEQLRRLDMSAGAHVVRAATRVPTAEIRQALALKRGARVHEIVRMRSANGTPVLLEETYLPAARFPGLLAADLTGSVYALMIDAFDTALFSADEHIEATPASDFTAELLAVSPGHPLLLVTRTAYDRDGEPVEFSHDYFRSDRTRIRVRSGVDRGPEGRVETSPAS
ncbi:GntR family transcriptional regulator [Mycolicibacterium sp. CBM1]